MKNILQFKHIDFYRPSCRFYNKKIKRIDSENSKKKTYNLTFKAIFEDIQSKKQQQQLNCINKSLDKTSLNIHNCEKDFQKMVKYNKDELNKVENRKRKKLITNRFFDEVFYHGRRFEMDMFNHKIYGRNNVLGSINWDFEENIYNDKVDQLQEPLKRDLEIKKINEFKENPIDTMFELNSNMVCDEKRVSLIENDKLINYNSEDEIDHLFDSLRYAVKQEQETRFQRIILRDGIDMANDEDYSIDQYEPKQDLKGVPMIGENEFTDKSFFAKKSNDFKFQRIWRKRIRDARDPNVPTQLKDK